MTHKKISNPIAPDNSGAENQIRRLDRIYCDQRGALVHVIAWDQLNQRVIFRRVGYAHDCMQPLDQFQRKFTRVREGDS